MLEDRIKSFRITSAIAVLQLTLLIVATILMVFVMSYLVNPSTLYLGKQAAFRNKFVSTYKEKGYDFMKKTNYTKSIPKEFDKLADRFTSRAFIYFMAYYLMVGLNIMNIIFGIIGYLKKSNKNITISALFAFPLAIYFVWQVSTINKQANQFTYSALNDTFKYMQSECSICSKHVEHNVESIQAGNMVAMFLDVFKCCGSKSGKDVQMKGEYPYMCCERKYYKMTEMSSRTSCKDDDVYSPCYTKLTESIPNRTMFVLVKIFMFILFILNISYSLLIIGYNMMHNEYFKDIVMKRTRSIDQLPEAQMKDVTKEPTLLVNERETEPNEAVTALNNKCDKLDNNIITKLEDTTMILLTANQPVMRPNDKVPKFNNQENLQAEKTVSELKRQIKSNPISNLQSLEDETNKHREDSTGPKVEETPNYQKISVEPELDDKMLALQKVQHKMIRYTSNISTSNKTINSLNDKENKNIEGIASITADQPVMRTNEVISTLNYQEYINEDQMKYNPISTLQSFKREVTEYTEGMIPLTIDQPLTEPNQLISKIDNNDNKMYSDSKGKTKSIPMSTLRSLKDDINKNKESLTSIIADQPVTGSSQMISIINDQGCPKEEKMSSVPKALIKSTRTSVQPTVKNELNKKESMVSYTADQPVLKPSKLTAKLNDQENQKEVKASSTSKGPIKSDRISNQPTVKNELNKKKSTVSFTSNQPVSKPSKVISKLSDQENQKEVKASSTSKVPRKSDRTSIQQTVKNELNKKKSMVSFTADPPVSKPSKVISKLSDQENSKEVKASSTSKGPIKSDRTSIQPTVNNELNKKKSTVSFTADQPVSKPSKVISKLSDQGNSKEDKASSISKGKMKSDHTSTSRHVKNEINQYTESMVSLTIDQDGTEPNQAISNINDPDDVNEDKIFSESKGEMKSNPISTLRSTKNETNKQTEILKSFTPEQQVTAANEIMNAFDKKEYQIDHLSSSDSDKSIKSKPISKFESTKDEINKTTAGVQIYTTNKQVTETNEVVNTFNDKEYLLEYKLSSQSQSQTSGPKSSGSTFITDAKKKNPQSVPNVKDTSFGSKHYKPFTR